MTNSPVNQTKALFLDRDGTINVEKHYVFKKEDFEFVPGIFNLIRKYSDAGFLIIITTNQSGIARGFYTEKDFENLTEWMLGKFEEEGIKITKVYYCPHHPAFTGDCNCRKPKPGMITTALHEFNINPNLSILIGDKKSDILAGQNAGIRENHYIHEFLNRQGTDKN